MSMTFENRLHCFIECNRTPACLSVNIKQAENGGFVCQLNRGVHSSQERSLVEDDASQLYSFSPLR